MNMMQVLMVAMVIIVGLTGCASSHTRHTTSHAYSHGKAVKSGKHGTYSSHRTYSKSGHHHYTAPKRTYYAKPDPYTLPGGLRSVCTGGTPPPCN